MALSHQWRFMQTPDGSLLRDEDLSGRNSPLAGFVPDIGGTYQLDLSVSDGADMSYDQVMINAVSNVPPVAQAGLDQTILLGQRAVLGGLGSYDLDGFLQPLSYQWRFVSIPGGSGLTNNSISGADTASADVTPDITGSHVLQIEVSDGHDKKTDNLVITVIQPKATSTVGDNTTPGSGADTFSIKVTGPNGFNYTASGTIVSGDYTISM